MYFVIKNIWKMVIFVMFISLMACSQSSTEPPSKDDPVNPPEIPSDPPEIPLTSDSYLGRQAPGLTAVRFVPDYLLSNQNWWWHGKVDFLDDGKEMFMDIYCPAEGGTRIRHMKLENDIWSAPATSPISSQYTDACPSFIDNGAKVFFISDRPNGSNYGYWNSTKTNNTWSAPAPVIVPAAASLGGGWEISATNDETLYVRMDLIGGTTGLDLYIIRKVNGLYVQPERLDNNINSSYDELGVFVDPEGDYMLFESNRPGGSGGSDIYISFRNTDGSFRQSQNLGSSVNSSSNENAPSVSSDGRYLFFLSERQGDRNPFWIDARIIENLR